MNCTATLTTATVEDGELIGLHTVACNRPTHNETFGYGGTHWHSRITDDEPWFAEWGDGTPGAKPHVEPDPVPVVTDAMVQAAIRAELLVCGNGEPGTGQRLTTIITAALRAQQQEDTP